MNDFEIAPIGTNTQLVEFRGLATLALHALRRGRPQILGVLVQEDQDFAIQQLEKFLKNHN